MFQFKFIFKKINIIIMTLNGRCGIQHVSAGYASRRAWRYGGIPVSPAPPPTRCVPERIPRMSGGSGSARRSVTCSSVRTARRSGGPRSTPPNLRQQYLDCKYMYNVVILLFDSLKCLSFYKFLQKNVHAIVALAVTEGIC